MNNAKIDSERRAAGIKRVNLETMVEICGRDTQVPAFEAESVELSGRGMHVRTSYLPELNAPLVLRFEDRGRDVVIEGEVAWRRELGDGGEFGIKFTALDPKGVEVLRELCGTQMQRGEAQTASSAEQRPAAEPGSPVKLHIEGLNAPMRARVRDASARRVQVGSNLEFLKVGRSIEIEDIDQGARKDAKIDSVTVTIDPQTQVPQLVVALRYGDSTPEPSVVDSEPSGAEPSYARAVPAEHRPVRNPAPQVTRTEAEPEVDEDFAHDHDEDELRLGDEHDDFGDDEIGKSQLKQGLERGVLAAQGLAKKGGVFASEIGKRASEGFAKAFSGAGKHISALRSRRDQGPKRRTAAATGTFSQEVKRLKLQPQHRGSTNRRSGASPETSKGRYRIAIGASAVIALAAGLTYAFTGSSSKDAGPHAPVAAAASNVPAMNLQGTAPALSPAPQAAAPGAAAPPQAVVADVPLYGRTTLAAPEPAPLGAAPAPAQQPDPMNRGVGTAPAPQAAALTAPAQTTDQDSEYEDQVSDDAPADHGSSKTEGDAPEPKKAKSTLQAVVQPWGKGRLHLPTVHRLRLDGPATAIKGYSKANGFSVLLPGRKVVENAKTIAKRDDRIASVTADSSREGAVVRFKFRGQVPSYKVRVRGDYVEFFISSAEHR